MKKALLLICIVLTVLSVMSCRTTYNVSLQPDLEDVFVGRTYAEIIDVLGAPDRVTPDGRGGEIIIYEDIHLITDGTMNPWTRNISLVTDSSKGYTHLYINSGNVCYQVRTNREKEVSEFSLGKTIGLVAGLGTGSILLLINLANQNNQKNK